MTDAITLEPLGTMPDGDALSIDLEALIGSHLCLVANSGGGKSGALRRLLETTHGHVQQIVLDIEDEFYTLREAGDYVIAGGDGGDCPANLRNAAQLARTALETGFSMIVQMNDLGADAPTFVASFLEAIMTAPRDLWHPLLIVIDETQRFAPSGLAGTDATYWIRDLVERGRKRGFTGVFASLAVASIDPRVRGLCNNWLLGRAGTSLDRKTSGEQLGFTAKEVRERMQLEKRHFWAYGPAINPEPVLVRIADVQTTAVRPGQAKVPTPPAPEALREILSGLAKVEPLTIDASAEGENVKGAGAALADMDQKNADLIRANAECASVIADQLVQIATLTAERDRFSDFYSDRMRRITGALSILGDGLNDVPTTAVRELPTHQDELAKSGAAQPIPTRDGSSDGQGEEDLVPAGSPSPDLPVISIGKRGDADLAAHPADVSGITPKHREVLDKVRWAQTLYGDPVVPREILGFLLGKHPRTKGLLNTLGELRGRGLIDYQAGGVLLTAGGAAAARAPEFKLTLEGVREAVRRTLSPRRREILDAVLLNGRIARADVAQMLGLHVRTKSLLNELGGLRNLKLIDYEGGQLVAAPFLMRRPA